MPQTFKKVILKDGHVTTEPFIVSGRKIPLSDIRERTLKEHEQLGLIRAYTDDYYDAMTREEIIKKLKQLRESAKVSEAAELNDTKEYLKGIERTRHLMIWADNSTLLNHGYLLMTVNVLYDEAVFFTNKEMQEQGKGIIDVQSLVQKPQVYIRSEAEQLAYINTTKICLEGLNNKITTSSGIKMMLRDCSMLMVPSKNLKVANRKVGMLVVQLAVVMQGDIPYLPVYKSIFYSLKICPKNRPRLIHGSKNEIKKSSG